ncbi:MAG: hypothetical protein U9R52_03480, partial [Candidatus Omnitrophota bacterium]|nr:hypothetical protein [Candidatus Omnitrophota bacterium]
MFKYDEVYLEYGGNLIYSGQTLYAPAGAPCTARVKVKNASDNEESFCVEMVNESLTSPKRLGGDPGGMLAGSSVKDIDISFDVPAEDAVIVFYTYWNKKNKGKVFEKQNDCRIFKYVKAEAEFVFDCGNNNCFITDFVSEYNKYSIITAHKSTSLYANVRIKNIGHAEGNYFFRVLAIYEDESEEPLGKSQRGTLAVSGARKITGIGASFDAPSADADIYFEVYWHDQDDYKKKHTYGPFEYKTLTLPAPAIIKPGLNNANPGAPEVISWKRDGLTGYVFDWEDIPAGHGVDKYKLSAYGLNGRYIGGIIIEGAPPVSEWVVPEDSA